MRILLATHAFHHVGGTETYVLTVAEHLVRLGHEARVYASVAGDMAGLARERGVDVLTDVDDLGAPPDVLLSQDSATAYDFAALWPTVPQVYVCHSELIDFQQPPLVPDVASAVVVMNDRTQARVEALAGSFRIVRLHQPIDTERLVPRRSPSPTPSRALLLGNWLMGDARRLVVETWREQGIEVVQVGTPTRPTLNPEEDLAAADIVVGKGRAILDAMSCGRPAYVYDAWGGDGWVTPQTFRAIEANSIAGQAFPDVVIDAARLRSDLADYDPMMGLVNRQLVTALCGARAHTHALVELAADLAPGPPRPTTEARELARQVRLRWRAESDLIGLRIAWQSDVDRHALAARQRVDELEKQLVDAESTREHDHHELTAERALRTEAERARSRARARARRLAARHDSLRRTWWVRLGDALHLTPRPRQEP